uniref:Uncharacterized protein n=1 Tax=Rheinheimera sp. BAL341 TaxID=1708203 RepID=A0A486XMV1_9GAMM
MSSAITDEELAKATAAANFHIFILLSYLVKNRAALFNNIVYL